MQLCGSLNILWRKWQPTPVFLPGRSHGQWSLVGYSPWGLKESDTTEWLSHFWGLELKLTFSRLWLLLSFLILLAYLCSAFLVAQLVKNPPAMWKTWVLSLSWEDPLERERLPTPVFWPGELTGLYSPWGRKESDTTEQLSLSLHFQFHSIIF